MNTEIEKFIELLNKLPEERQSQVYYIINGLVLGYEYEKIKSLSERSEYIEWIKSD